MNKMAEECGQLQLDVMMRTIEHFVVFIERVGQRNKISEKEFLGLCCKNGLDSKVRACMPLFSASHV